MNTPTFIIRDMANGYTETHEFGDVAYALAAFPPTASVFQIEWDDFARNFLSIDITEAVVRRAMKAGDMNAEDEITLRFYDWPETVTIGDQDYYRTEKGLVAA
jgi:hypothetical protein